MPKCSSRKPASRLWIAAWMIAMAASTIIGPFQPAENVIRS